MRNCLLLLKKAVAIKEASAVNLAYLSDRIAVFENKPQKFGSQFDWNSKGELSPNNYDNLEKVNQRRKSLCLSTLEEQTKLIRNQAEKENQIAPENFKQRQKEFETWKLEKGWISTQIK